MYRFDGKSMYPGGDAPSFTGDLPSTNSQLADAMIYTGGCHCGAVTLAFRSSPLSKVQVKEDNCSICRRVSTYLLETINRRQLLTSFRMQMSVSIPTNPKSPFQERKTLPSISLVKSSMDTASVKLAGFNFS